MFVATTTYFGLPAVAQADSNYRELIQQGKHQLETGDAKNALLSGETAIKIDSAQWEGYALVGGAEMNLKRYKQCEDSLSKAIKRAPEGKQTALNNLRQQCIDARRTDAREQEQASGTTTEAEIVLWKMIENSANPADFQSYLDQYPRGAFAVLAHRHVAEAEEKAASQAAVASAAKERIRLYEDLSGNWTNESSFVGSGLCPDHISRKERLMIGPITSGAGVGTLSIDYRDYLVSTVNSECVFSGDRSEVTFASYYDVAVTCGSSGYTQGDRICTMNLKMTRCEGRDCDYAADPRAGCAEVTIGTDHLVGRSTSNNAILLCEFNRVLN